MTARRTPARRTVYRVEDADGGGPYSALEPPTRRGTPIYTAHENAAHPTPSEDGVGHLRDDEMCGLASLPALRTWFADWGAALDRAGFRVVAYRVPKHRVRYGQVQLVFVRGGLKPSWSKSTSEAWVW